MVSGVIEYAQRMDIALREVLPEAVIGTYLHGSGALGGFVHGLSDVDLLFVIADTGHSRPADEIGRRLAAAAAPCPGRGLEASVVTETQAHTHDSSWPFVVHLSTDPADRKIISGENHPGDPDLLMHFAVACAAGIAISGPPPTEVFLAPSRRSVLNYLVRELDDALEGPFAYAVLNACRAWRYFERGDLVSKIVGGTWALDGEYRSLVQRALDQQQGTRKGTALDSTGATFVAHVRDLIEAHIARSE